MKKLSETIEESGLLCWITDKYIYTILLFYPLFVGFWGYTRLTASKYFFFAGLTLLWVLSLAVVLLIKKKKYKGVSLGLVSLLILLYLFFCCLSALFSPHKGSVVIGEGRFDGLFTIILCCLVFFGVSSFSRMKTGYIYAMSASGLLCCAIAIIQLFGYNPLRLFPLDYSYYDAGLKYSSEFLGTIGNADLFSAFLCLLLPLNAAYYITSKKRPLLLLATLAPAGFCLLACRVSGGLLAVLCLALVSAPFLIISGSRLRRSLEVLAVICAALCIAAAFHGAKENGVISVGFTLSKASVILLILAVISIIARLAVQKKEFKPKFLWIFFSLLSVLCISAGLVIVYLWPYTGGTVYEISQTLHGNFDDSFGSSRILIWRKVLALIPERLLLGGGPGTLPVRLDVSFYRYVTETGVHLSTFVDNAHNVYLGMLANTGLLSLLCYVVAQAASLWNAWRQRLGFEFSLCLACALLCYWIQAFFGLGLFIVSPVMWLFWGLLASDFSKYSRSSIIKARWK